MVKNNNMKVLDLITRPELFQGKGHLYNDKNYFEGWYFKITNNNYSISFIPGINIDGIDNKAFIQVITNVSSYFVSYDIGDFEFSVDPFYIKIKNNLFSKNKMILDILDYSQSLKISGSILFTNSQNINTTALCPNIMGPFSYVPFMECKHAVLSMKNIVYGSIKINDNLLDFNSGLGYIEKDWGSSFPESYIWCQGNDFDNSDAGFMLAVANIPFASFHFKGFICDIIVENREFRFATYNNSKLVNCDIDNTSLNVTLKKNKYIFNVTSASNDSFKLLAPIKGKMEKDVFESICSDVVVSLRKDNCLIFSGVSKNCGVEIVKD